MNPLVQQTRFGEHGNCTAACWASLLGVPLECIPELCDVPQQFTAESEFAASLDLSLYSVADHGSGSWNCPSDPKSTASYMASGPSPRGISHRVLMANGVLVYDPHPEGGGIQPVERLLFVLGNIERARRILLDRTTDITAPPPCKHEIDAEDASACGLCGEDFAHCEHSKIDGGCPLFTSSEGYRWADEVVTCPLHTPPADELAKMAEDQFEAEK